MHGTENHLVARRLCAPKKTAMLKRLWPVLILAVIFGSIHTSITFAQIVHEESQTGGSSSSITVTTSASLAGVNNHLYLAAISSRPKKSVSLINGLGLNWTLVKSKCAGRNTTAIEVWMAQGTPNPGEAVTATFASAPATAAIVVSRYSGVLSPNPIGSVIAGNSNGLNSAGACSGGVDGVSYSFSLTTTASNAVVYAAAAIKGRNHTPGAGYAERAETHQVSGLNTSGVATEDKSVASAATVTVNGTFGNSVDWALAAFEIKPAVAQFNLTVNTAGSGSVTSNPPGSLHNSGTVVTLTATPNAGFQFSGWSGDLSDSTNPATITMNSNKNVTANFTVVGSVVHEETQTGGSSNSATVATAASLTGANYQLYLAAISMRSKVSVSSVNGLGLNWTLVKAKCAGRNTTGIEVWMAQGAPLMSSGPVTATFASAPSTAVIVVSRYSGVAASNPIGNTIAGNSNGLNAAGVCSNGSDGSSYLFNLATSVNDAVVYSAVAIKGQTHTSGATYIERAEIQQLSSTNPSGVAVEDKSVASISTAPVDGSFSGAVDWALAALEIKPQSAGPALYTLTVNKTGSGNVTLNPPGNFYISGAVVTLTATADPGFQFSGWSGDLSGATNPASITMDGNKNVTATFTALPQYSLTLNTLGSGSVAFNPPGGIYDSGTVVTLTATPASGFQFSGWSGDLTSSNNPASITIDGNKTVAVIFAESTPSGQIVHLETKTGGSTNSTTVSTSASLIGANGHLYLAAISSRRRKPVANVNGLGLTWSLVKSQCSGQNKTAVEVWKAQGNPTSNGIVTATFSSAPINAVIAVSRYAGTDAANPIGNIVSGNTVGVDGVCSGGVDTSLYAFPLTTTLDGAVAYGAVAMRARIHTPGAGYIERAEIKQDSLGNAAAVAVEDKTVASASTVTVNGSFNGNVDWAMVAVEIKPPLKLIVNTSGSGTVTLDPAGGFYLPGTVVTLTATPNTGFEFSSWSGDLSGSTNPATITMDANKNVTATFTSTSTSNQIAHEETKTGGSASLTTVATSTNVTAVSGHFYLAAISTRPQMQVSSISGLGMTWTLVKSQCSGRGNTGIEVWMAQGTPTINSAVTATLANAPNNAVIAVSRYSGVDALSPLGTVISGNFFGENGVCTDGSETNAYSFNLTTTANGAMVYGAVSMRSKTHTQGAGFTERADFMSGSAGSAASVAVEDKTVATASTVTVNGSFSGMVDWAAVALEMKPSSSTSKRAVKAADEALALPTAFQLEQNYPNPFSANGTFGNSSTMIKFSLPAPGKVTVNIYDETGGLVRALVDHEMAAGRYSLRWNGRNQFGRTVAAGIYLYRIVAQGESGSAVFTQTRRMLFLK